MDRVRLLYDESDGRIIKQQQGNKMSQEKFETIGIWVANSVLLIALIAGHFVKFK